MGQSHYTAVVVGEEQNNIQFYPLGEREFNIDRKSVYLVKGKPDLLAISQCEATNSNAVQYFYIKDHQLTQIKSEDNHEYFSILSNYIKSSGENKYQYVLYNNAGETSWYFLNYRLDTNRDIFVDEEGVIFNEDEFELGEKHLNRWQSNPVYIVITK